jgi:hypothetical protein
MNKLVNNISRCLGWLRDDSIIDATIPDREDEQYRTFGRSK